jgi:hypothetical protein
MSNHMPLKIGGKPAGMDVLSLYTLPQPKILQPAADFPLDACVIIDTGEACYTNELAVEQIPITLETSTCLQLYFSQKNKGLLIHFSADFNLDFSYLFRDFDLSQPIELTLIGAGEPAGDKPKNNVDALLKALNLFCTGNPHVEIHVVSQLIGRNFNTSPGLFAQGDARAKYPDIAYKADGTFFDMLTYRPQNLAAQSTLDAVRSIRRFEGEYRAWLGRSLGVKGLPRPNVLLIQSKDCLDLSFIPHPIVLAFVKIIKDNNEMNHWIHFAAEQLYSNPEHSLTAKYHKIALSNFLNYIMHFADELEKMRKQCKLMPDAPYSPELLVYLQDDRICEPYEEKIREFLMNLGFVSSAVKKPF